MFQKKKKNTLTEDDPNSPVELNEDLIRHMVLNSLRAYKVKFQEKYGKLVICCDNRDYWRKKAFTFYKANRKKQRDKSILDINLIFATINKLRQELIDYMPYRVIDVGLAEADDIIAVLTKHVHTSENILILSGDHDFVQLHKYPNVDQFAPVKKEFVKPSEFGPVIDLQEQILTGCAGDGIPNFLSEDNVLAIGERQKSLSKEKLKRWKTQKPENFCDSGMLRRWKRNSLLIDFDNIPKDVKNNILEKWNEEFVSTRKHILPYFVKFGLDQLVDHLGEF